MGAEAAQTVRERLSAGSRVFREQPAE